MAPKIDVSQRIRKRVTGCRAKKRADLAENVSGVLFEVKSPNSLTSEFINTPFDSRSRLVCLFPNQSSPFLEISPFWLNHQKRDGSLDVAVVFFWAVL